VADQNGARNEVNGEEAITGAHDEPSSLNGYGATPEQPFADRPELLVGAAVLGAWAGDTVGSRMAIDPIRIGEFHLLSASLVAGLGIGLVAVVSVLAPERRERIPEERVSTVLTRSGASTSASGESDDRAAPSRPTGGSTPGSTVEPEPQAPR
jgi:hypothetical protein